MKALRTRFASILLAFAALVPLSSRATIYDITGLWYNPNESGWGLNLIQQNGVVFATMFVYGTDGKPTWYVASNTAYVSGSAVKYTGPLYATTGPYFGGAFNPSAVTVRQVGTITLDATCSGCNIYTNMLVTYSVDGVTVTKNVQQQAWASITMPSSGYGALHRVNGSTCSGGPATNPIYMTFTFSSNTLTMTDANGVRYTVGLANVAQYGNTRVGTPSALSISNSVTFTQGLVQLESGNGVVFNGLISGTGSNGCNMQIAFIGSATF